MNANKTAAQHGVEDAQTFAAENPDQVEAAIAPGQYGADEALISAMGVAATNQVVDLEALAARAVAHGYEVRWMGPHQVVVSLPAAYIGRDMAHVVYSRAGGHLTSLMCEASRLLEVSERLVLLHARVTQ
jgi:stage V sporulation protein SpoVS